MTDCPQFESDGEGVLRRVVAMRTRPDGFLEIPLAVASLRFDTIVADRYGNLCGIASVSVSEMVDETFPLPVSAPTTSLIMQQRIDAIVEDVKAGRVKPRHLGNSENIYDVARAIAFARKESV
jgi:hypothetical protein